MRQRERQGGEETSSLLLLACLSFASRTGVWVSVVVSPPSAAWWPAREKESRTHAGVFGRCDSQLELVE